MPDIKLKGWSGHEWEHKDVPLVWLNDADGIGKLPFTYGEAVSKTVEPDFSGGDMSVPINEGELVTELTVKQPEDLVPENIPKGMYIAGVGPGEFEGGGGEEITVDLYMADGDQVIEPSEDRKLFSKVTVNKPDSLIPENIAKGVDIAGVVGTLMASEGAKVAIGTIAASYSGNLTVTHGLGVVPDLVLFQSAILPASGYINIAYGASTAFRKKINLRNVKLQYSSWDLGVWDYPIETTLTSIAINNANSQTFSIAGTSSHRVPKGGLWVAIGGLA